MALDGDNLKVLIICSVVGAIILLLLILYFTRCVAPRRMKLSDRITQLDPLQTPLVPADALLNAAALPGPGSLANRGPQPLGIRMVVTGSQEADAISIWQHSMATPDGAEESNASGATEGVEGKEEGSLASTAPPPPPDVVVAVPSDVHICLMQEGIVMQGAVVDSEECLEAFNRALQKGRRQWSALKSSSSGTDPGLPGLTWVRIPARWRPHVWDALLSIYPDYMDIGWRTAMASVHGSLSHTGQGGRAASSRGSSLTSEEEGQLLDLIPTDVMRSRFAWWRTHTRSDENLLTLILQEWVQSNPSCQYHQLLNVVAAVFLEGYRSAWLPYSGGADNAASNTTSVPNDVVFQLVRRLQKVCAVYLSGLLSRGKLSKVAEVRRLSQFQQLLSFWDPALATHLIDLGIGPEVFAVAWISSLFADVLPLNAALNTWDVMFCFDSRFPLFLAAAAVMEHRNVLLNCSTNVGILMAMSQLKQLTPPPADEQSVGATSGNTIGLSVSTPGMPHLPFNLASTILRATRLWLITPSAIATLDAAPPSIVPTAADDDPSSFWAQTPPRKPPGKQRASTRGSASAAHTSDATALSSASVEEISEGPIGRDAISQIVKPTGRAGSRTRAGTSDTQSGSGTDTGSRRIQWSRRSSAATSTLNTSVESSRLKYYTQRAQQMTHQWRRGSAASGGGPTTPLGPGRLPQPASPWARPNPPASPFASPAPVSVCVAVVGGAFSGNKRAMLLDAPRPSPLQHDSASYSGYYRFSPGPSPVRALPSTVPVAAELQGGPASPMPPNMDVHLLNRDDMRGIKDVITRECLPVCSVADLLEVKGSVCILDTRACGKEEHFSLVATLRYALASAMRDQQSTYYRTRSNHFGSSESKAAAAAVNGGAPGFAVTLPRVGQEVKESAATQVRVGGDSDISFDLPILHCPHPKLVGSLAPKGIWRADNALLVDPSPLIRELSEDGSVLGVEPASGAGAGGGGEGAGGQLSNGPIIAVDESGRQVPIPMTDVVNMTAPDTSLLATAVACSEGFRSVEQWPKLVSSRTNRRRPSTQSHASASGPRGNTPGSSHTASAATQIPPSREWLEHYGQCYRNAVAAACPALDQVQGSMIVLVADSITELRRVRDFLFRAHYPCVVALSTAVSEL